MAKSRALEDTLAALHELRAAPMSDHTLAELRRVLAGKSAHAAAKAAQIIGELEVNQLIAELIAAFDRFMTNPVKSDPGCAAKAAIVDALYRIGADTESIFLRGVRHVQLEPVWGGKTDTAASLRGVSALGLVRINYREVLTELADLLADPEAAVRAAAARAIAYSENEQGVPLLRLKVLVGDEDPQVVSECLAALLQLAPHGSLPFVAHLLDAPRPERSEAAALALGASRIPAALTILRPWWERTRDLDLRRTGLLAIAMLKCDPAIEFLVSLVAEAPGPTARDAIAALALYRHDEGLTHRIRETVEQRTDADLRGALSESFSRN